MFKFPTTFHSSSLLLKKSPLALLFAPSADEMSASASSSKEVGPFRNPLNSLDSGLELSSPPNSVDLTPAADFDSAFPESSLNCAQEAGPSSAPESEYVHYDDESIRAAQEAALVPLLFPTQEASRDGDDDANSGRYDRREFRADPWRQRRQGLIHSCQVAYGYLERHIGGSSIVNFFRKRKAKKYQSRKNPRGVTRPQAVGGYFPL